MKRTLLYSVIALGLVLGLILPVQVMAQGHGESKYVEWDDTSGHPEDVYIVGQTVYYSLNITNHDTMPLSVRKLVDRVPVDIYTGDPIPSVTNTYWWDDYTKAWVDEDPNYEFSIPGGQSWNVTFNYTIREGDASGHPSVGYNIMINRFCANGTAGELGCDTAPVRVIHPAIMLVKAVDPEEAQVGQNVTYTFNISNTGDWPLEDINLDDDVLGDLTGELPPNLVLNATGEAGDCYSFAYNYTIKTGDLPLENEATVESTAQGFNATIFPDAVVMDSDTARVISEAPPVGGTAYPVSKVAILVPWIALGAAIIAGAAIFRRRGRVQS